MQSHKSDLSQTTSDPTDRVRCVQFIKYLVPVLPIKIQCDGQLVWLFSLFLALLFSATFRKRIERLARDILNDPVRIVQGDIGEVSRLSFLV